MILQRHNEVFKGKDNIHVKKNGENFLINFLRNQRLHPLHIKRPVPYYI